VLYRSGGASWVRVNLFHDWAGTPRKERKDQRRDAKELLHKALDDVKAD